MLHRVFSTRQFMLQLKQVKSQLLLFKKLQIVPCWTHCCIAQLLPKENQSFHYFGTIRQLHTSPPCWASVIEVEGPSFAESISEGDIRWLKQKNDFVNRDDIVAEIETDKTTVEVPATESGTIVELLVEDGGRVVARQKLYKLEIGGDRPTSSAKDEVKSTEDVIPSSSPPSNLESSEKISPLSPEPPTVQTPKLSKPLAAPPTADRKLFTGSRGETRVKMSRMRLRTAQRLKDAQNTCAMLTTFNEVDMSSIMDMRTRYQKEFIAKHGIKIGLMSPFIRAASYALQDFPIVNAVIEGGEILYRHYVDISIAVATPKGLVVPVLRSVEAMDYATIERTLNEFAIKARDGKLSMEEMEGGTFTISNGGVFGSLFGTPIINPPQSAILGMHTISDRPVAVNGKVEIRPMMTVALTYDHRLIDGREAVSFLRKIKTAVEDPRTILLNL